MKKTKKNKEQIGAGVVNRYKAFSNSYNALSNSDIFNNSLYLTNTKTYYCHTDEDDNTRHSYSQYCSSDGEKYLWAGTVDGHALRISNPLTLKERDRIYYNVNDSYRHTILRVLLSKFNNSISKDNFINAYDNLGYTALDYARLACLNACKISDKENSIYPLQFPYNREQQLLLIDYPVDDETSIIVKILLRNNAKSGKDIDSATKKKKQITDNLTNIKYSSIYIYYI